MKQQVIYRLSDCQPDDVRKIMEGVGSRIGSVHFKKRKDGSTRKMCYRLHVQNPTHASTPKSQSSYQTLSVCQNCGRSDCKSSNRVDKKIFVGNTSSINKKVIDHRNDQMTVFDVNKVIGRDDTGKQKRGAWRTVPLENVIRICANGVIYEIESVK